MIMSVLKFENRTPRSLEEMHRYLTDPTKTDVRGLIGFGVNPYNPVAEMRLIQSIFLKENLSVCMQTISEKSQIIKSFIAT